MIFPHKFSSGDYSSVYYADEEYIVGLLHPTTESDYIPEAEIIYGELVDTIEYEIMEATEIKKVHICDDYDYICWEEHEMDVNNSYMYNAIDKNIRDKIYIRVCEQNNGAKYLVEGNNIVYLSYTGWDRGVIESKRNICRREKKLVKETRAPVLVRYVIGKDKWLYDFG